MRPLSPRLLIPALLAALLLPATAAALDRTLVVRGRAVDREGSPIAGARISARGGATLTATTDASGRYELRVMIGSPASLERASFALEVRAEYDGRRLPFAIQGSAFALDVSLVPGTPARARVRSNAPSASLAVAAAFVSTGAPEAVVEIDFGGAGAGGAPRLSAVEEVPVANGAGSSASTRPSPPSTPAPVVRTPPASSPRPVPAASSARRDSLRRVAAAEAASLQRARAETLARARLAAREARGKSTPRITPRVTTPIATSIAASARQVDTLRTVQLVVEVDSLAGVPGDPEKRVQRIDPWATTATAMSDVDSCACRLRGTVEVDWDRPLEQDLPVEILLTGPASQRAQVELFIGSPREFHMGPLPCGTYQLELRPAGRLRYGLARGDGRIECRGSAQVRVVLTPVRR